MDVLWLSNNVFMIIHEMMFESCVCQTEISTQFTFEASYLLAKLAKVTLWLQLKQMLLLAIWNSLIGCNGNLFWREVNRQQVNICWWNNCVVGEGWAVSEGKLGRAVRNLGEDSWGNARCKHWQSSRARNWSYQGCCCAFMLLWLVDDQGCLFLFDVFDGGVQTGLQKQGLGLSAVNWITLYLIRFSRVEQNLVWFGRGQNNLVIFTDRTDRIFLFWKNSEEPYFLVRMDRIGCAPTRAGWINDLWGEACNGIANLGRGAQRWKTDVAWRAGCWIARVWLKKPEGLRSKKCEAIRYWCWSRLHKQKLDITLTRDGLNMLVWADP